MPSKELVLAKGKVLFEIASDNVPRHGRLGIVIGK